MDGNVLRRAAVFHAVGLSGGITAAGVRLGKSPPTIHADLRQFERDIGVPLTERVGRTLRLTQAGRGVFDVVGRALADLDYVCASAREGDTAMTPIRLGAVAAFGRYRLIANLLTLLPTDRRLHLMTDTHDALLIALSNGAIDLAITYRPVLSAPFQTIPVATETIVLVGVEDALELEHATTGRLRFITYDEYEYVFARWFADAAGIQPGVLRRHDHFSELEEALTSVSAGRGATIAPYDACVAANLKPAEPRCQNEIFLCGTAAALASDEAGLIADCLKVLVGTCSDPSEYPWQAAANEED